MNYDVDILTFIFKSLKSENKLENSRMKIGESTCN